MSVTFDFDGKVVLVTGAAGALGSAVCEAFTSAGAVTVGADVLEQDDADSLLNEEAVADFIQADFTREANAENAIEDIIETHGRLDVLANVAGTWKGGQPIEETPVKQFGMLFEINLLTVFLTSKHAIEPLRETGGAIVNVSARSSLSGGAGDGPYRASKAGVRILTESLAEENLGEVRANAVMPSVIDTPMNREMMPDADHDTWVSPAEIADVILWLASDGAEVTSGAAVPVYGEA